MCRPRCIKPLKEVLRCFGLNFVLYSTFSLFFDTYSIPVSFSLSIAYFIIPPPYSSSTSIYLHFQTNPQFSILFFSLPYNNHFIPFPFSLCFQQTIHASSSFSFSRSSPLRSGFVSLRSCGSVTFTISSSFAISDRFSYAQPPSLSPTGVQSFNPIVSSMCLIDGEIRLHMDTTNSSPPDNSLKYNFLNTSFRYASSLIFASVFFILPPISTFPPTSSPATPLSGLHSPPTTPQSPRLFPDSTRPPVRSLYPSLLTQIPTRPRRQRRVPSKWIRWKRPISACSFWTAWL